MDKKKPTVSTSSSTAPKERPATYPFPQENNHDDR